MSRELLIAGGGIGGLAAALAARRAGWAARLFEQAEGFSETGAGIQLGPNVTRILREWQLLAGELSRQASAPQRLRVRDAVDGRERGSLALADMERRYGAPYLTLHRADLQAALLARATREGARLHPQRKVQSAITHEGSVRARTSDGLEVEGEALVAADGLWSALRSAVADSAPPRPTGHLAYRALSPLPDLPPSLRANEVTVWLAPRMHLVSYPVRAGAAMNAVCVVEGQVANGGDPRGWDHPAVAAQLRAATGAICVEAQAWLQAMPGWRLWALHDRPPVAGADALAQGRIALLGDAGHPMRPYLAQGAGMAIEDARELERVLDLGGGREVDVPLALRRYALQRWQRVARVQRKSARNGLIFHASGALRLARNVAMRVAGERLLDQPWLYR